MRNSPQHAPIDFVVLWVDDTDPVWQEKKTQYTGKSEKEGNTVVRYRDWDTLKYWFRGVEKFAPWVNRVFFVTDNQKPNWLKIDNPKLEWVKHTDYMPAEYLPTFNSNAIELNLFRLETLSENFVLFNDDMFLIRDTEPENFFQNDLPCDFPILGVLYPNGFFSYLMFNNIDLLNRHFSLKKSIAANPWNWIKHQSVSGLMKLLWYGRRDLIPNSVNSHIPSAFKKSTFMTLWEKEYELMHSTSQHKLRERSDITQYCVRDWQLFSGQFHPQKPIGKLFHTASMSYSNEAMDYFRKQKGKIICLNDSEDEQDFELHKQMILDVFEKLLPEKSSFEL